MSDGSILHIISINENIPIEKCQVISGDTGDISNDENDPELNSSIL